MTAWAASRPHHASPNPPAPRNSSIETPYRTPGRLKGESRKASRTWWAGNRPLTSATEAGSARTTVRTVVSPARTALLPSALRKGRLDSATPNHWSDRPVGGNRAILSLPNATPIATTMGRLRNASTRPQYTRSASAQGSRRITRSRRSADAERPGLHVQQDHGDAEEQHAQGRGKVVVEEDDLLVDEEGQDERVAAPEEEDGDEAPDGQHQDQRDPRPHALHAERQHDVAEPLPPPGPEHGGRVLQALRDALDHARQREDHERQQDLGQRDDDAEPVVHERERLVDQPEGLQHRVHGARPAQQHHPAI